MEFENQLRLAKHLHLIHDQQSSIYNFQCELCGKTFLYKTNLKRHKKLEHEGLRYSCHRCMTSFRSKIQLNEHHRIVHLGLLLKCDACDQCFHTWTTLRDHERASHGKHAPIFCVVCGKKFTRYPGLSYHLRKHHKRKYNVAGEITVNHMVEDKRGKKKQNRIKTRNISEQRSSSPQDMPVEATAAVSSSITSGTLSPTIKATSPSCYISPPSLLKASSVSQPDTVSSIYVTSGDGGRFVTYSSTLPPCHINYNLLGNAQSYVPSFYDQQFNLPDIPSPQKGPPDPVTGVHAANKMGHISLPTYVASHPYEPSVGLNTPQYDRLPNNFGSRALYNDAQEATSLCLSDAINFYDDLTLSPEQPSQEQQHSPIPNSLHSDEFVMFNN